MPLFEVDPATRAVREIPSTSFPKLKLWERRDLEAWVEAAPAMAGGDFTVVTTEYDRFDRTSERLDVLGVVQIEEGVGRLVVVELKREGSSTTVDLQAIKYAAYVAASQFSDVVDMYAAYHAVDIAVARELLIGVLGGDEDNPPSIDSTPRIVLVAGDFRPEVTTTVLWLIDNFEVDIRCVRLQPFEVGDRVVVSSEVLIPLPGAEQYRLGVRRKRIEVEREQEQKARAGRLLPRLMEAGALAIGQVLSFRRDAVPSNASPAWSQTERLYRATIVTDEGVNTLEWADPDSNETHVESPSLLAARILGRLGKRDGEISSAGVNGMHYWTVDGEKSLRDLGRETGVLERVARPINRTDLYELCSSIPPGAWMTYGDVATALGVPGAAQSVASIIANDPLVENAHRVLRAGGRISPDWRSEGDGGPEVARKRLEDEGVHVTDGDIADPNARWKPEVGSG